jgi:hypothetical protein
MFVCYALAQVRAGGKNKENGNDTDCNCGGGCGLTNLGCLGDVTSRTDCAARGCNCRRSNGGHVRALVASSSSPLLARTVGAGALPLVVRAAQSIFRFAAPAAFGAAFLLRGS